MDRTEFYPAEVRVPLEEPQLSIVNPPRRFFSHVLAVGGLPTGTDWEREQKMNAELFPEFVDTIEGVEEGIVELQSTGELTNSRVFRMLQHQLLDDLVRRVDTNQENVGLSQAEIRVLDYLDVVLPISPDDEVVENSAGDENPKPSWFDYVTQQAKKVEKQMTEGDLDADNVVVLPETRVKAMRAGRVEQLRGYLWRTAIIAGVGAVALVGGEVAGNVADIDAISDATEQVAKVLGGWAGFRTLKWAIGSQVGNANEKAFAKRLEFPLISKVNYDEVTTKIKYADILAGEKKESDPEQAFEEYYGEKEARKVLLIFLDRMTTASGPADYQFEFLANVLEVDTIVGRNEAKINEIYRLLEEYLPISDKDTVTPVNELTGEKTWRGFFEDYLAKKKK